MADTADALSKRLRCAVSQLVRAEFDAADGLYGYQMSLLDLLIDVQAAIGQQKAEPASGARASKLAELRFLRAQTYELGNAFAWVVLGLNRRAIGAMRMNRQAPAPKRDASLEGVKVIAGHLAGKGYGFPLIHDITSCLRIGDVTFVDAAQTPPSLWTCEIKTSERPGKPGDPPGTKRLEIQVLSTSRPPAHASGGSRARPLSQSPAKRKADRRIERQMSRMRKAHAHLGAAVDQVVEIGGERHFVHLQQSKTERHVGTVNKAALAALDHGTSVVQLEPGVVLAAWRIEDGDEPGGPWMKESVIRLGELLNPASNEPDGISLHFFPDKEAQGHLDVTPYHLLGLDEEVVARIATGGLLLVLAVRVSMVYSALERAGLAVTSNGMHDLSGDNMYVSRTIGTPLGEAVAQMHLAGMAWEALHEFQTLDSLARRVAETLDAVTDADVVRDLREMRESTQQGLPD